MKRKNELSLYVIFIFLFLLPLTVRSQNLSQQSQQELTDRQCENIISRIRFDIISYPSTSLNPNLPWMNVSWLQSNLGYAKNASIYDYIYVWKNFSLFIGADGSVEKIGTLPNQIQANTLDEVINVLGKPKQTYSEKLNLLTWTCPTNMDSYLAVLVNDDGVSISIMGKDCIDNKCNMFSSTYSESELKHKFKQKMHEQEEISINLLAVRLKNYNDYFKTSFQNQTQLHEDIISKIKNYYTNLRQCKTGIYQYAIPVLQDYLYQVSVIKKQEDNRCVVDTSYKIPHIGKIDLKCKFSIGNLSQFSDAEAESVAGGFSNFDSEHPTELQKIISSECKRYIGGVL